MQPRLRLVKYGLRSVPFVKVPRGSGEHAEQMHTLNVALKWDDGIHMTVVCSYEIYLWAQQIKLYTRIG